MSGLPHVSSDESALSTSLLIYGAGGGWVFAARMHLCVCVCVCVCVSVCVSVT